MNLLESFLYRSVLDLPIRRKYRTYNLVNLANNELHHPLLEQLQSKIVRHIPGWVYSSYPSWPPVVEKLGKVYALSPEQILLTAGSDDAYKLLTDALYLEQGTIVTQAPNYEQLFIYAQLRRRSVETVRFRVGDGFSMKELIDAQANRRVAVFVSNPNGPTGSEFSPNEMEELVMATAHSGNILVIDEAYIDFSEYDHLEFVRRWSHVIVVRSFSKGFALAGMRLAMVIADATMIDYLLRWNMSSSVSATTQRVVAEMLDQLDVIKTVHKEIRAVRERFSEVLSRSASGLNPLATGGNFVPIQCKRNGIAETLCSALRESGFLIRNLSDIAEMPRCVRVTVGEEYVMDEVLKVLVSVSS